MAPLAVGAHVIRWWNAGRYERECAAFDAEHPLSREVWESLQRSEREAFAHPSRLPLIPLVEPRDSLRMRDQSDPWQEFADRVYREQLNRLYHPVMIVGV